MNHKRLFLSLFFSIVAVLVFSPFALGQIAAGTIFGNAKDSSGAVLPGVSITVTNQATGLTRTTTTSSSGDYVVPQLLPGTYEITASKTGFQTNTESGLALTVAAREAANFTLSVGAVTQQVSVQASGVHLETGSSSLGQVINGRAITNLPLNGRDFVQLTALGAGATPVINASRQDEGSNHAHEIISVNISGGRGNWNSWLVDGVETKQNWFNTPSTLPSVDTIQEFRVMSSNSSAEYGGAQSIINVITKSGGNQFHGVAYEFLRNDLLDALNYFDKKKPPYRQNQFGGTLGGPIIHNRTFFFFGYEGLRTRQGNTIIATVPNPQQLKGNFSGLSKPIIDPQTGTAFPDNMIPQDRFSKVATNFISYIPAPNNSGAKNLIVSPSLTNDYDQYMGRVDYSFSSTDQMFGRYLFQNFTTLNPGYAPLYGNSSPFSGQNFTLQETHTWGGNSVNSFKLAFNRGILFTRDDTSSDDLATKLGLTGIGYPHSLPSFSISGYSAMGGAGTVAQGGVANRYQVSDTLSLVRGKHDIATGVDFRHRAFQNVSPLDGNGAFSFDGRFTNNALADFLLGLPAAADAENSTDIANLRSWEWGVFFQDNYKATQNLTLNMGLRWDYFGPWGEIDGKEGVFDPTFPGGRFLIRRNPADFGITFDPILAPRFVVGGVGPGIVEPRYDDLAPRVGFAFQASPHTAIRGAYGIFYVEPNGNEQSAKQKMPPFSVTRSYTGTPSAPVSMDGLFPSGAFLTGILSPQGGLDRYAKTPQVQQWNLSIQRQLGNLLVEAAYLGTVGRHLDSRVNVNQAVPAPGQVLPVQPRRPFPIFGDILKREFQDISSYNGLQMKAQEAAWHGFTFLAAYTYSKSLDTQSRVGATEHQDSRNLHADYGPSSYNIEHVFNFSYSYALPFGKGGTVLSDRTGVASKVISGWQINGITTLLSGLPFNATEPATLQNVGGFAAPRLNCVGNWHSSDPSPNAWFNPAAFVLPSFGAFGNCSRNDIVGPGTVNFDFSAFKTTHLTKRTTLQFRAEFFNVFNHPNFDLPDANIKSPTYNSILSARSPREIQFALKLLF